MKGEAAVTFRGVSFSYTGIPVIVNADFPFPTVLLPPSWDPMEEGKRHYSS